MQHAAMLPGLRRPLFITRFLLDIHAEYALT